MYLDLGVSGDIQLFVRPGLERDMGMRVGVQITETGL